MLNQATSKPDLIGFIICIDEEKTGAWRERLNVNSMPMDLSGDEGLARHHIHNWLVLAPLPNKSV